MIKHEKYISSSELVIERLCYVDGVIYWKNKDGSRGVEAGTVSSGDGYRYISMRVLGKRVRLPAHRVAYFLVNGVWPEFFIDHIDHNRLNNKIDNLRVVTNTENQKNANISKKNRSGVTGVHFNKQKGKWKAEICVNRKVIYLGIFKDFCDAVSARKHAEVKYGFHKNHGIECPST